MQGIYEIKLRTSKCGYIIKLRRNITVIQGNSGTGKTLFCNLLRQYLDEVKKTGQGRSVQVSIAPMVNCLVLTEDNWESCIEANIHNTIIVIDEDYAESVMKSSRFTKFVNRGDNYFVLITRDLSALESFAISVNEIYTLTDKNGYNIPKSKFIVNTNVPLWCNQVITLNSAAKNKEFKAECVITEDGKSGYKFFKKICQDDCDHADGKSNIAKKIKNMQRKDNLLIVVDGAAFGSNIECVMRELNIKTKPCALYMPESFEWLMLHSLSFAKFKNMLSNKLNVSTLTVESTKFLSWERYFTALFKHCCKELGYSYDKSRVPTFLCTRSNIVHILSFMKEQGVDMSKWKSNVNKLK